MRGAASIHPPQLHSKLSERGGRLAGPGPRALFHRRGGNSRRKLFYNPLATSEVRAGHEPESPARTLSAERGLLPRKAALPNSQKRGREAQPIISPAVPPPFEEVVSTANFLHFKLSRARPRAPPQQHYRASEVRPQIQLPRPSQGPSRDCPSRIG